MSQEDDIFLKTFNEMISILKEINVNIGAIKKSIEIIVPSIDGLGAGLTDINNQISDLTKKFASISEDLIGKEKTPPIEVAKAQPVVSSLKSIEKGKPVKEDQKVKTTAPQYYHSATPQHPIFIDLAKKINESSTYQEAGEIFIEALDQIESNFSFSRVFYEIRRVGNSLIRKSNADLPPNEKLELNERIIDWEQRLSE